MISNWILYQVKKMFGIFKLWYRIDKQERAYELIKMAKNPNDYSLIEKAPFILESFYLISI